MLAIRNDLVKIRQPLKVIPENSPKGESQSNGKIERANRSVKGQFRCLLFALEARLMAKVDLRHPIVSWMVQHGGYLITHFQVDKGGKTPYERLKGKASLKELSEFGEKVHYMPLKTDGGVGPGSLGARYVTGIWLGINERNSEVYIGLPGGGVTSARSIKRLPEDQKWDKNLIEELKGTPWNLSGVENSPKITFGQRGDDQDDVPLPVPREEIHIPRRVRIGRTDLEQHGFTDSCPGCEASQKNGTPRGHTERCRNRLMEALRGTDDGRKRINEAVDRIVDHLTKPVTSDKSDTPENAAASEGAQSDSADAAAPPADDDGMETPQKWLLRRLRRIKL